MLGGGQLPDCVPLDDRSVVDEDVGKAEVFDDLVEGGAQRRLVSSVSDLTMRAHVRVGQGGQPMTIAPGITGSSRTSQWLAVALSGRP